MVGKIKLSEFIMVKMSCFHQRERRRKEVEVGQVIWCLRCHKDQTILELIEQFRIKCDSCRFGRLAGTRRAGGGYVGTKHWRKNPTHRVQMYLGTELVREWEPQAEKIFTKILPGSAVDKLDVPPF